ncbi:hypothetical protein B2A_13906, partial [mine drainage metagenome]
GPPGEGPPGTLPFPPYRPPSLEDGKAPLLEPSGGRRSGVLSTGGSFRGGPDHGTERAPLEPVPQHPRPARGATGRSGPLPASGPKGRRHPDGPTACLCDGDGHQPPRGLGGPVPAPGEGVDAWALTHQDFALYPPPLSRDDALITISHRGNKRYGMASLQRAQAAGMPVVGLTGLDSPMAGP